MPPSTDALIDIPRTAWPDTAQDLREEVRDFIAEETATGHILPGRQSWTTWDRDFSIRCAERGYVAMTWPKTYGGRERSALERFVVLEELLAGGAPLGAHWIADRQSGPQIMRYGSETLRRRVLPAIAAGRCTFAIGMSEPDAGSDLAAIRSRASRVDGGWMLNGRKVWTTNAHHADYMIVLCRTRPPGEERHSGMTQLVVGMSLPGISVRPLRTLNGQHEFNEVVFDDCVVDDDHVLGSEGDGWRQVIEELAFERSGPDRFLSTFGLLRLWVDSIGPEPDEHAAIELGRLTARLSAVRQLSWRIAGLLDRGGSPGTAAALTKELGTTLEQDIPETVRRLAAIRPDPDGDPLPAALAEAIFVAPAISLRGGTREILKGIIARELGLR